MKAVVERLKKEKSATEDTYFEKGKLEGARWVQAASYKDLSYFDNWKPGDGLADLCNDDVLGRYFSEVLSADPMMRPGDGDEYINVVAERWLDGWLEGAGTLWDQIRGELN